MVKQWQREAALCPYCGISWGNMPIKWGSAPFGLFLWGGVECSPGKWCENGSLGLCCAGLCRIVPVLRCEMGLIPKQWRGDAG